MRVEDLQAPLSEQEQLIAEYSSGNLSLQKFAIRGYDIVARRLDTMLQEDGKPPVHEKLTASIRTDAEGAKRVTATQYAVGRKEILGNQANTELHPAISAHLPSVYKPFLNDIAGGLRETGVKRHFMSIYNDLSQALGEVVEESGGRDSELLGRIEQFRSLFWLDMYTLHAKEKLRDRVYAALTDTTLRPPYEKDQEQYWQAKWWGTGRVGGEGILFLLRQYRSAHLVAEGNEQTVGIAETLFPDDTKRAMETLHAIITLKTTVFTKEVSRMNLADFRIPILKALAVNDVESAYGLIEDGIYEFPAVFTQATLDRFGITADMIAQRQREVEELAEARQEAQERVRREETRLNSERRAAEWARKVYDGTSPQAVEKALQYKGHGFLTVEEMRDPENFLFSIVPKIRIIIKATEQPYQIQRNSWAYQREYHPIEVVMAKVDQENASIYGSTLYYPFKVTEAIESGAWFPLGPIDVQYDGKNKSFALSDEMAELIENKRQEYKKSSR